MVSRTILAFCYYLIKSVFFGEAAGLEPPHDPPPVNTTVPVAQPYDFLIITDFVRTGGKTAAGWGTASDELISFSWVVIDTRTRTAVDAKSLHICPQWTVQIQPWMTDCCGITSDVLKTAPMLPAAIQQVGTNLRFTSRNIRMRF